MGIKRFRKAFVTDNVLSTSPVTFLQKYCEEVVELVSDSNPTTTSYRTAKALSEHQFNPDTDVIIPVGKVNHAFITGYVVSMIFGRCIVGIFQGKDSEESYEFTPMISYHDVHQFVWRDNA